MEMQNKQKNDIVSVVIPILSVFICIFHIFITLTVSVSVMQQRLVHVFTLMLLWYVYRLKENRAIDLKRILFAVAAVVICTGGIYYVLQCRTDALMEKGIFGITFSDIVFGILLMLFVLEIARETIGIALPIIAAVFLLYAFIGPYLPNVIAHRGYDIPYIINYVCWTNEGIFGTPVGAAASFVVLYIIFGELLDQFGSGKFFIDISYALTGRMRGGPAEASVLSSALMGSINGSAVANVVTTGTFTIPLMKKVGYRKEYAGAVEAVASTGGQILPPVMGAAAFVMADMTGIAYSTIVISALVPGLLYYISLGIAVYLEAGRMGIKAESDVRFRTVGAILKEGWYHIVPLAVLLICLLVCKFSANYSAIFAILSVSIIGIIKSVIFEHTFPLEQFKNTCIRAARSSVAVSAACACAGIVIGIVSMTGLGVRFAQIVLDVSHGHLFLMLLMTMVACIVLGMGLPSTAAYVIAATVASPALIQAGVSAIAANLFVFYFAIISFITPPVAIAAYAASGIAESDAIRTGFQAFLLGLAGFIIPFMLIYHPGILILGTSVLSTIRAVVVAFCAVCMMAVCIEGWLGMPVSAAYRVFCFIAAVLLLIPTAGTMAIGLLLCTVLIIFSFVKKKRNRVQ